MCTSATTVPLSNAIGESRNSSPAKCAGLGSLVSFQAALHLRVAEPFMRIEGPFISVKPVESSMMCVTPLSSSKARAGMSGTSMWWHRRRVSTAAHTSTDGPDCFTVGAAATAATRAHTPSSSISGQSPRLLQQAFANLKPAPNTVCRGGFVGRYRSRVRCGGGDGEDRRIRTGRRTRRLTPPLVPHTSTYMYAASHVVADGVARIMCPGAASLASTSGGSVHT